MYCTNGTMRIKQLLAGFVLVACRQDECEESPTGITETNEEGVVLIFDLADWKFETVPPVEADSLRFKVLLRAAYPNPATDSTTIVYEVGSSTQFSMKIIDPDCEPVKTLYDDQVSRPGAYQVVWRLDDENGDRLGNGLYRCLYEWESETHGGDPVKGFGHGDIKVE